MSNPSGNLPTGGPGPQGQHASQFAIPGLSARDRAIIAMVDCHLNGHENAQLPIIGTRITHLSNAQQALTTELAEQKKASLKNNRAFWAQLMKENAQRTQEIQHLQTSFSAAIEATQQALVAETTNRTNETTALRSSIVYESSRCTQELQDLRAQVSKDVASQSLWDTLVKECNDRKQEVAEVRAEMEGVSKAVKKLIEEKKDAVHSDDDQPQQTNDAATNDSDEVIKGLKRDVSRLWETLEQQRKIQDRLVKILDGLAGEVRVTGELMKGFDARLDVLQQYTLIPLLQNLYSAAPSAAEGEGEGNAGDGAAGDGQ